ncbi:hypothetical protein KIW84_073640 [Lathyrus oleraceus]|uniref:Uncharacterized protein n=1 Tax=Pisum sativum TaxID=3888 RepID=A0A9D4ZVV4_PEA|nr:hypothetical protein KIW84_073640 [Pisum sativum]
MDSDGFPGPRYLSVGIRLFRIPWADSDGDGVSAQRPVMMMMYLSSVYFGTRGSELCLFVPQMVMISSETRFSATEDQMTGRMAQCIAFIHHPHFASICTRLTSSHMGRIIARARRVVPLHSTRPHRYFTRHKSKLMDPSNADILELKEKMGELISVMQEFALEQKVLAEKVRRIEDWLKMGNMQGNASSSGPKKSFGNDQHKDEGESSVVYAPRGHGRGRYYQHTAAVTIPADNQPAQQQQQRQPFQRRSPRVGYPVRRRMSDRHFDRPPVTYSFLLKKLKDMGLVQLRTLAPMGLDQRPANFDENVKCEFHSGAPGHSVEDCKAFKHVVQDLVDSKALNFTLSLNADANPMPAHGQAMVGAIAENSDRACAVGGETDSDCKFSGWIKPCVPGGWKA